MRVRRGGGRGVCEVTAPERAHVRSNRAGVSRAPDPAKGPIGCTRCYMSGASTPPRGTLQKMDRLRAAVGNGSGSDEINKCVKECLAEGIDISGAFDYCVDEESVDALVAAGGDPSVTQGVFELDSIPQTQACLNITRRLYHGARGLHKEDLSRTQVIGDIIYEFSLWSSSMASPLERPEYYVQVDEEKFDFWLKFKPSVYSTGSCQPEEIARDGCQLFIVEHGRMMFMRPEMHVKRGGKKLKTLYTKKELTVDEWEGAERAFGEYHRRICIRVSCERENASKKSRRLIRPRKSPRAEGGASCRQLKYLMHSLPIEVARKIILYV